MKSLVPALSNSSVFSDRTRIFFQQLLNLIFDPMYTFEKKKILSKIKCSIENVDLAIKKKNYLSEK